MKEKENFFQIPDAETLSCQVWMYEVHHGKMKIRIHEGEPEGLYWLHFAGVAYFEGPMHWTGANFRLGTSEEILDLQYLLGHHRFATSEQKTLERARLYIATPQTEWLDNHIFEVRILALDAALAQ